MEVGVPRAGSVKDQFTKMETGPVPFPWTPIEGFQSSLVVERNAFCAVTWLDVVLMAPYRTAGKPLTPCVCVNHTKAPSWYGVLDIRPSSTSRPGRPVPGWRALRVGAAKGELPTACAVTATPLVPDPVMRYSW